MKTWLFSLPMLLSAGYSIAQPFSTDFEVTTNYSTKKQGVRLKTTNTQIIAEEYDRITENNFLSTDIYWQGYKGEQCYLLSTEGRKIFSKAYPSIQHFDYGFSSDVSGTYFIVKNEAGKYGILNPQEKTCLDFVYDSITLPKGGADIIALKYQGKWGIKDDHTKADWLAEPMWERMDASQIFMPIHTMQLFGSDKGEDIYVRAYKGDKMGLWALNFRKWIIEPVYDDIIVDDLVYVQDELFGLDNLFQVQIVSNGKRGIAQWNKEKTTYDIYMKPEFDVVMAADGFRTSNRHIPAKKDGKWGIWHSKDLSWVPVDCDSLHNFNAVRETTAAQLAPAFKNDLWGYVDTKGNWAIPAKWDDVDLFFSTQPRAFVMNMEFSGRTINNFEIKWLWGIIDDKGNEIVPTKYNMLTTNDEATETLIVSTQTVKGEDKQGLLDAITGKVYYPCKFSWVIIEGDDITLDKKGLDDIDWENLDLSDIDLSDESTVPEEKNDGKTDTNATAKKDKTKKDGSIYIKRSALK